MTSYFLFSRNNVERAESGEDVVNWTTVAIYAKERMMEERQDHWERRGTL